METEEIYNELKKKHSSKGSMGWPGYNNGEFPQWAIDIIMYRNKKFNEEVMELCFNTGHSYQTCSLSLERK